MAKKVEGSNVKVSLIQQVVLLVQIGNALIVEGITQDYIFLAMQKHLEVISKLIMNAMIAESL